MLLLTAIVMASCSGIPVGEITAKPFSPIILKNNHPISKSVLYERTENGFIITSVIATRYNSSFKYYQNEENDVVELYGTFCLAGQDNPTVPCLVDQDFQERNGLEIITDVQRKIKIGSR